MAFIGKGKSEGDGPGENAKIEDFVYAGDVAASIGVHTSTIKRWVKDGRVEGVEWGRDYKGAVVIKKESVALLEAHYRGVVK